MSYTIMPHKIGIRLLGIAENPANIFPARLLDLLHFCQSLREPVTLITRLRLGSPGYGWMPVSMPWRRLACLVRTAVPG